MVIAAPESQLQGLSHLNTNVVREHETNNPIIPLIMSDPQQSTKENELILAAEKESKNVKKREKHLWH